MRLPTMRDVWVYWECGGFDDVSRVRDLSTGGIFIETPRHRAKGELVRVHFLVPEGQISLDSVVAQAQPPLGLGLKFQTLDSKGISKLSLLLERVRAAFLAEARGAVYECDEGSRR
jgi:hypothetical protein